jgi:hypothetical protein
VVPKILTTSALCSSALVSWNSLRERKVITTFKKKFKTTVTREAIKRRLMAEREISNRERERDRERQRERQRERERETERQSVRDRDRRETE